ncbi:uncharacterized protein LOC142662650 [Rhinoderma darwinii]|uniref:uncharacterized protein LOC142662650 n=1 Tax=Rhinoderma darwinii TaxID=43563 RepID=UPI003F66A757
MAKTLRPQFHSSQYSTESEEREVTVSVRNPHTPGKDVAAFLRRYCTVVRNPSKILNGLGFWTGNWSVIVRLKKDPSTPDGLQHLPQRCTLGDSEGLITYSDMPEIDSKMESVLQPESSSTQCATDSEERQVTVSVRNPHTPGKHVAAFLRRYCTVVRSPTKILNGLGFWTGNWSVTVRLRKDPSTSDGLQHLPQRCTLGDSEGLITYSDMPEIDSKMGQKKNECTISFCSICTMIGHEAKSCPSKETCDIQGQTDLQQHQQTINNKDCPKRSKKTKKNQKKK